MGGWGVVILEALVLVWQVTPMFDREQQSAVSLQIGFIDFVCDSVFKMLADIVPDLKFCHENLRSNRASWAELDDAEFMKGSHAHLAKSLT